MSYDSIEEERKGAMLNDITRGQLTSYKAHGRVYTRLYPHTPCAKITSDHVHYIPGGASTVRSEVGRFDEGASSGGSGGGNGGATAAATAAATGTGTCASSSTNNSSSDRTTSSTSSSFGTSFGASFGSGFATTGSRRTKISLHHHRSRDTTIIYPR